MDSNGVGDFLKLSRIGCPALMDTCIRIELEMCQNHENIKISC